MIKSAPLTPELSYILLSNQFKVLTFSLKRLIIPCIVLVLLIAYPLISCLLALIFFFLVAYNRSIVALKHSEIHENIFILTLMNIPNIILHYVFRLYFLVASLRKKYPKCNNFTREQLQAYFKNELKSMFVYPWNQVITLSFLHRCLLLVVWKSLQ